MSVGLVWLRRDLRLADNPALAEAVRRHGEVLLCFCFEVALTNGRHSCAARNAYLLASLHELERELREIGGRLVYREGDPASQLIGVAKAIGAETIYSNQDHTAYGRSRDRRVGRAVTESGIGFEQFDGITCVDVGGVEKEGGGPYKVFTPFYRTWRELPRRAPELRPQLMRSPEVADVRSHAPSESRLRIDEEAKRIAELWAPGERASSKRLDDYIKRISGFEEARDRPDLDWTSRLSAALHFGCVSARGFEERLSSRPGRGRMQLRRQLAWRDFFLHLTHHFPGNLRRGYEQRMHGFRWRWDAQSLQEWKQGTTGIPLVDAGMRQLLAEGWMHSRVRMVTASFLTKHLLVDWREGERHFMQHLIDGDAASNNGNWQWAASVGADTQPNFRVFSPSRQMARFDPDGVYVRRWVPELEEFPIEYLPEPWKAPQQVQRTARCEIGTDYPEPVIDLVAARNEAVARFRSHLERTKS